MKVINLFGGPGTGKSTVAADLFAKMKWMNKNVELIGEYAKDATWEKRHQLFDDQLYILAKQNRKLERLKNQVEYVITDSPLLLNIAYIDPNYFPLTYPKFVRNLYDSYNNLNIFLLREKPYHAIGRRQTEEEARAIDARVIDLLHDSNQEWYTIKADEKARDEILKLL